MQFQVFIACFYWRGNAVTWAFWMHECTRLCRPGYRKITRVQSGGLEAMKHSVSIIYSFFVSAQIWQRFEYFYIGTYISGRIVYFVTDSKKCTRSARSKNAAKTGWRVRSFVCDRCVHMKRAINILTSHMKFPNCWSMDSVDRVQMNFDEWTLINRFAINFGERA